jgi:hypothetical protein
MTVFLSYLTVLVMYYEFSLLVLAYLASGIDSILFYIKMRNYSAPGSTNRPWVHDRDYSGSMN